MFVFVIDTSFMNVSISAVVHDLDTTVSGVQSAVAIEALVSAAFILISSKVGDLFGRKRAFVVGMVFYAVPPPGPVRDGPPRPHSVLESLRLTSNPPVPVRPPADQRPARRTRPARW